MILKILFSKDMMILKTIKDELVEMGAVYSSMSGTGATCMVFLRKKKRHFKKVP